MFYRDLILEDSPIADKKIVDIYPFRSVGNIKFGQSRTTIRNTLNREKTGNTPVNPINQQKTNSAEENSTGGYKNKLQKKSPINVTRINKITKKAADRFDSYKIYYDDMQKCNKIEVELNGPFSFRVKGRTFTEDFVKNKKMMMMLDRNAEDSGHGTKSNEMGITLTRANTLIILSRQLMTKQNANVKVKSVKEP